MRLVVGVRCVFYFSLRVAVGLSESCLLLPGELSSPPTPPEECTGSSLS